MKRDADNGPDYLEDASPEMRRSNMLAPVIYEKQQSAPAGVPGFCRSDFKPWREQFLRGDPMGCLARAEEAAQAALRARLDTRSHRQALWLLATARCFRGDHRGEAATLEEAARREPDQAGLWLRLADACGRARQFAAAEHARDRGLAPLEQAGAALH